MSDEPTPSDQIMSDQVAAHEATASDSDTGSEGSSSPAAPDSALPDGSLSASQPVSLVSPLMSGRSLEPMVSGSRKSWLREHLRVVVAVAAILTLISGVIVAKILAENAALGVTTSRVEELRTLLDEASPRDFLAFNAGVKVEGSVAQRMRDEDGFVNLQAGADMTTIRIQPSGWWAGFTERCIVISVREDQTLIDVVKRSCVRVDVSGP